MIGRAEAEERERQDVLKKSSEPAPGTLTNGKPNLKGAALVCAVFSLFHAFTRDLVRDIRLHNTSLYQDRPFLSGLLSNGLELMKAVTQC